MLHDLRKTHLKKARPNSYPNIIALLSCLILTSVVGQAFLTDPYENNRDKDNAWSELLVCEASENYCPET